MVGVEVAGDVSEWNWVVAIAQQILKLSEQTNQISVVTNLMTDFANETKMLAMNAAVEAEFYRATFYAALILVLQ